MKSKKNLLLFFFLVIIIFALQFILARKHLEYGFNNDDWYVLAWYKQIVNDPIRDVTKAWKDIGPHNFAHAYYIGPLFEIFKFNFPLYHIFNAMLKGLAGLSIFPLVFLLFKNRFLAVLTTILFASHFTPFGALNNVLGGEDSLVVVSINLFLAIYVWASQKHLLSNLKVLFLLLILLLGSAVFDVTRAYPFIMSLPLLEAVNFFTNKSSTNLKSIFLRLLFLYSPFIALIAYSPFTALNEFSLNKLTSIFRTGNYQLFTALFASFGSTFIPLGLIEHLNVWGRVGQSILYEHFGTFLYFLLFRYLIIVFPLLAIFGSLAHKPGRFIIRSLLLNLGLSLLTFMSANHWMHLDPKIQYGVDPGTYLIPGLIGLFVFSASISFLLEWFKQKSNYYLLILSLAPIFSLLYTFLTWILVGENAIFMGVHAYLNVAAIGSSIYLSALLYLAFQKIISKRFKFFERLAAALIIFYFVFFFIGSFQQIDNFYAYWLKNGFKATEQQKIHESFWKEVGLERPANNLATLIYLDGSEDYNNGYFYSGAIVWDIPAMLTVRRGEPFDPNGFCKTVVFYKDFDKLKIKIVNDKKMIIQDTCKKDLAYPLENFYAFKMTNRNLVSIKSAVLKELELRK